MIEMGDRLWWRSIRGLISGVAEGRRPGGYLIIRLDDGGQVLVSEQSIARRESPVTGRTDCP